MNLKWFQQIKPDDCGKELWGENVNCAEWRIDAELSKDCENDTYSCAT